MMRTSESIPAEFYLKRYFESNPGTIANRLGIIFDPYTREFMVTFIGESYRVTFPGFRIVPEDDPDSYHILTADATARNILLRYLLYGSVFTPNGDFMAVRELPAGELHYEAFDEICNKKFLEMYGERFDAFSAVCKHFGASRVHVGDLAYELEVFENLYVRFILKKAADGKPAAAQILFSSNFPAAFSTSELAGIASICLRAFSFAEVYDAR